MENDLSLSNKFEILLVFIVNNAEVLIFILCCVFI